MATPKLTARRRVAQRAEIAPRVFGYARVSTERQADSNITLDEQQHRIQARCLENGWGTLERVFVDGGVSGSIPLGKRPEGGQLLAVLKPGDIILAAKLDRCFRSAADALATIEDFRRRKISLWLLDLGGDCSGNGISQLIITILSAVADFERGLIGERVAATKANLRRQGKHQGGVRPFGFRFGRATGAGKSRKLIPDEAEQRAIAEMATMRATGMSLMAISAALQAQGFRISHQSVKNILERRAREAEAA
jgi:putative DNA-invertase from lambdoid prophage Rac